jgi:hypothetical protein
MVWSVTPVWYVHVPYLGHVPVKSVLVRARTL